MANTPEENYALLMNGATDPQTRANADAWIAGFKQSPQGLQWAVQGIPALDPNLKFQALLIIKDWCKSHWENVVEIGAVDATKMTLFTLELYGELIGNESFRNTLTDAQISFMWKIYPEHWPAFWMEVFPAVSDDYKIALIQAFCNYAKAMNAKDTRRYNGIKNKMREDTIDKILAEFVLSKMAEGNVIAFECFARLSKWVNVDYLITEQSMSVINQGCDPSHGNLGLIVNALDIYTVLVTRGTRTPELKAQLIAIISVPTRVGPLVSTAQGMLESDPDTASEILKAAGLLLNATGLELIKEEAAAAEYLGMAAVFLGNGFDDVSESVIPFILDVVKTYPGAAMQVLPTAFQRIMTYFARLDAEDLTNDTYLDRITMIAHSCIQADPQNTLGMMAGIVQAGDFWSASLERCVAVIHILYDALSGGSNDLAEPIQFFINTLAGVLKIPPPFTAAKHHAVYSFVRLFIAVEDKFPPEVQTEVFGNLVNFATTAGNSPEGHQQFADLLVLFIKKKRTVKSTYTFEPGVIYTLVQSLEASLVSAAAMLIQRLPPANQPQIFSECITHVRSAFESAPDEHKRQACEVILTFMKSMRYDYTVGETPYTAQIGELLTAIFPLCAQDDAIFALYIRTMYSSLAHHGISLFSQCVEAASGPLSIAALSKAGIALVSSSALPDKSWCSGFISAVIGRNLDPYSAVADWGTVTEENKPISEMVCHFIKLCGTARQQGVALNPECYQRVSQFILHILQEQFDVVELLEAALDYVASIIAIATQEVFQGFAPSLFYCVWSPKFDPMGSNWSGVCKRILNLHASMLKAIEPDWVVQNIIVPTLGEAGICDSELIQSYLAALTQELPRHRLSHGRQFFMNLIKVRKSQGMV